MIKYIWRVSSGLIAGAVVATAMIVTPVQAQQGPSQEVCEQLPQHIRVEYSCSGSAFLVESNAEETAVVAAVTEPSSKLEKMKPHKHKHYKVKKLKKKIHVLHKKQKKIKKKIKKLKKKDDVPGKKIKNLKKKQKKISKKIKSKKKQLNKITKGKKGPKGPRGPRGPRGPKGPGGTS